MLFDIDRINENPKGKIIWRDEQINYIVKSYQEGLSLNVLSKKFQVHRNSIKKVLEENKVIIRGLKESRLSSSLNHEVFKSIDTEEKAYWLGFFAADGNIFQTRISCNLQFLDKNHLEKMKKFFGSDKELVDYEIAKNNKVFKYSCLTLYSTKIAEDLIKHGVPPKKSLILKPPLFLKEEKLKIAWIRGYFDGDGGINISNNPRRAQMYFTGTQEVLNWIKEILNIQSEIFLEHNCSKTYRLSFNGWQQVYNKANLLYQDAQVYLDRKHGLFLKLKEPSDLEIRRKIFKEEALNWTKKNKEKIIACSFENIYFPLVDLFKLGEKYNFSDRRSVSRAICGSQKTKDMLKYLKSTLQQ